MKILVTGGNGFIGLNFIHAALKNNIHVTCIDNLCYSTKLNIDDKAHKDFIFIENDIRDKGMYEFIKKNQFDAIVNFAAETHVDKSIHSDIGFISTNVYGTHNLISICRILIDDKALPKHFKFIQISTDEVYGSLNKLDKPFTESSNLRPSNPYSASKTAADVLCISYWKTYGFPVIVTRCSNNYGPYQYPEKLIPLAFSKINKNNKVPIYGDGLQIRDWIHVDDHCEGILKVLKNGRLGEIYNFGGNSELTNIECVQKIIEVIKPNEDFENYLLFTKDRPGHDRRYAIDSTKALHQLDWQPKISFDEGIKSVIDWYSENYEWVENQINSKKFIEWEEKHY
tara:strand:+ start:508 stop:1530 length:1023 start_codon:yes stop_codon:yes gene_type:complete